MPPSTIPLRKNQPLIVTMGKFTFIDTQRATTAVTPTRIPKSLPLPATDNQKPSKPLKIVPEVKKIPNAQSGDKEKKRDKPRRNITTIKQTNVLARTNGGYRMAAGQSDPLQDFVNLVNKAKHDRKIFTVCGNFFAVRRSLVERGWLEKVRLLIADKEAQKQLELLPNNELFEGMKDKLNGEKYRRALISKLLARHQVDFYWDYFSNPFSINSDKIKRTLINRYPGACTRAYGSKAGLCESLAEAHWYCIDGVSEVHYPRTYNLTFEYDRCSFAEDFQMTAATSLLKWIIHVSDDPNTPLVSSSGKIPVAVFNFAIIQCQNFIRAKQHKDIDEVNVTRQNDWNVFLEKFYKLIHNVNHFRESNKISEEQMVQQARLVLKKMEKYWPHLTMDGFMNLWLLKPANGSQGCGILICRTLKYILDTVKAAKDKAYVVQKYIGTCVFLYLSYGLSNKMLVLHYS